MIGKIVRIDVINRLTMVWDDRGGSHLIHHKDKGIIIENKKIDKRVICKKEFKVYFFKHKCIATMYSGDLLFE